MGDWRLRDFQSPTLICFSLLEAGTFEVSAVTWSKKNQSEPVSSFIPMNVSCFRQRVINVLGDNFIKVIESFDTPMVWNPKIMFDRKLAESKLTDAIACGGM